MNFVLGAKGSLNFKSNQNPTKTTISIIEINYQILSLQIIFAAGGCRKELKFQKLKIFILGINGSPNRM